MSEKNYSNIATLATAIGVSSLISYYFYRKLAKAETRERSLNRQLAEAKRINLKLQNKLESLDSRSPVRSNSTVFGNDLDSDGEKKEIRIWMDGAFDMFHYGHMNAFRQGRALGTYLIAGINSDATITACKGPPVCNERERIDTVAGCRFVDEVVEGVPYVMNEEYLTYVIEKYNIDFVVHGDDPCIVDGKNVYETAIKMDKYLTIPRTEGISTTDIVGRMLLMTRQHHHRGGDDEEETKPDEDVNLINSESDSIPNNSHTENKSSHTENRLVSKRDKQFIRKTNFLTTSHTLHLFGAHVKAPEEGMKIVYVGGAWDMFHAGHIEILKKAKQLGDYLIVGVHNDYEVNKKFSMNLPILNLHERVLSVLGCKYVDDVLIDAPVVINREMISSLKIDTVVCVVVEESLENSNMAVYEGEATGQNKNKDNEKELPEGEGEVDAFSIAREVGIVKEIKINYNLSALDFVDRIQNQKDRFSDKFKKKMKAEKDFYKSKYSLL